MKKKNIIALLLVSLLFTGCDFSQQKQIQQPQQTQSVSQEDISVQETDVTEVTPKVQEQYDSTEEPSALVDPLMGKISESDFKQSETEIPRYDGTSSYVEIDEYAVFNNTDEAYISLTELDYLGRCGTAEMLATYDALPTEERGEIGHIKPSGWHTVKYDIVDGKFLYNRCHLLMYALSRLNDDERNLITGTRYMNVEGMLPWEEKVLNYIKETKDSVYYRVTPIYTGENLVADGVVMTARSKNPNGLFFNVYVYNVQPGISIDYATGESYLNNQEIAKPEESTEIDAIPSMTAEQMYIVNTNTGKYHYPTCDSTYDIKTGNRQEIKTTSEALKEKGYEPCKRCNP